MSAATALPVLGFAAWSGSGKTTLLRQVLPLLEREGLRVGVVKHAHHSFDIDYPGKDSYELRKAGARQVLVGSRQRWALICETPERQAEPALSELMQHLTGAGLDLILVEGFKPENIPKIEVHRPSLGKPLLCRADASIIAVCTDAPLAESVPVPVLDLNDAPAVAAFVLERIGRPSRRA